LAIKVKIGQKIPESFLSGTKFRSSLIVSLLYHSILEACSSVITSGGENRINITDELRLAKKPIISQGLRKYSKRLLSSVSLITTALRSLYHATSFHYGLFFNQLFH